jgi:hypothetical protein
MPARRRSIPSTDERPGVNRRRFLRAAGVGTAGAVVAAGAVVGQAGAAPDGLAVATPRHHRALRAKLQGTQGAEAVQVVSGPLSLHTISPQRYIDTRSDGGGPFPPQGATGDAWIWDLGHPEFFGGGVTNEVPPNALAVTFNVTVTGGTSGGNLRAFPAASPVIPLVANVNWTTGQTVGNFAVVAATSDASNFTAVAFHNASTRGSVHVIVDIFGYYL